MNRYGSTYRNLLWPAYEGLRGRQTHKLFHTAEARQWWSIDRLRDYQWQEITRLIRHAHAHTTWYRRVFEKLSLGPEDVRTLADFQRLPPLGKEEIRQSRDEMVATQQPGPLYAERTGGSTGVPLQYFYNRGSYEWRLAVSQRGYSWAGCEDGARQFYLWGEPIGTPPWPARLKTKLHNAFLRRRLVSSFRLTTDALHRCVAEINGFRPLTIIGYTNALALLAQHILDTRPLRHQPTGIITAAEGVNSLQRDVIQRAFGAPVFASYGSREFMLIGMECDQHNGLHLSADNLLIETIRPDGTLAAPGEVGEILVTDLHNFGMPLIRYKIGDLGVLTTRVCSCGRGLPLLERVEGRVLDMIRTPDGRMLPGEFFPHLMKEFESVRQFQVIQTRLDRLQIKLVLGNGNPVPRIEQEVRQRLGTSIQLDIQAVDEIPVGKNGKFRVTISELP
ncbi:MAG: phenylacetate--CoA ligase family protein [Verrucomicrobiota bacterium]